MIKGISAITNLSKGSSAIALIAGAMTLASNAAVRYPQASNTTMPTELISKNTVEALKTNFIIRTSSNVPKTHNYKLDKTLEKFTECYEDKTEFSDYIKQIYSYKGTFYGSAVIQHEIDRQMFDAFLAENTDLLIKNDINPELGNKIKEFGAAFFDTVKPYKDKITNWKDKKYSPKLANDFKFDHNPTAEEVCERLDYIVENKAGFTKLEKTMYYMNCDTYIKQHMKNKDTQSMSDFIAYKMYLIDSTIMEKAMSTAGVFGSGSFHTIKEYYQMWMKSVEPSKQ